MATPDLSKLSLEDLKAVKEDAENRITAMVAEKRADLERQLRELDALTGGTPAPQAKLTVSRQAPPPKYRSKKNPALTWSARGSQPTWLKAEIEETSGKLDDFAIK